MDLQSYQVWFGEREVSLTSTEFSLLQELMTHPGMAIKSQDLLDAIWHSAWPPGSSSALHVYMSRLRSKLGESGSNPGFLQTVRGYGYRFDPSGARKTPGPSRAEGAVAHLMLGADRVILWASESCRQILGSAPDALVGSAGAAWTHPDDLGRLRDEVSVLLETGSAGVVWGRHREIDGRSQHLRIILIPILSGEGQLLALLIEASVDDALDDEASSAGRPIVLPAREAVPRGRVLDTETPLVPVTLVYDRTLTLLSLAPRLSFLGWIPEEILGRSWHPTGLSHDVVAAAVKAMLDRGEARLDSVLNIVAADGSIVPRATEVEIHPDGSGWVVSLRGIIWLLPEDVAPPDHRD